MTDHNIALIGQFGAGKTTIAKALVAQGYNHHSWATPVKEIARWAYGPIDKEAIYLVTARDGMEVPITGRQILQRVGTDALRDNLDQDFWIKVGVRHIEEGEGPWVNDDTRFPNEVAALQNMGWLIVRLLVPDEIRMQRYEALYGRRPTEIELNHPSETLVTTLDADIIIGANQEPQQVVANLFEAIAALEPLRRVS